MQPNTSAVMLFLLNKLQSKPSPQFTQSFVFFALLLCAIDQVGPDFLIGALDGIQNGLFGSLCTNIILPNTQKQPIRNRRVVEVGLTKILSRSEAILAANNTQYW